MADVQLYHRFCKYADRLRQDLTAVAKLIALEKRGAFEVPEYDFAMFCERWKLITRDESLHHLWLRRLEPSGYDDEKAEILSAIDRMTHIPAKRQEGAAA